MKRIISITIALCLVFCSVLPVYAEAWTSNQASSVTNNLQALLRVFTGSVGTMYNSVSELMSWLTPAGSFNTSHSITGVTLYEIVDYIAWTLSGVGPTVYDTFQSMGSMLAYMPSLDSKFTTNNNHLDSLKMALSNMTSGYAYHQPIPSNTIVMNGHYSLFDVDPEITTSSRKDGRYGLYRPTGLGGFTTQNFMWQQGSPLGNIALILKEINNSFISAFSYRWSADLKHYNDNLTTWDSQGTTLTQVGFTPESAIQGLYRYLAFTQRDVARLAYVFANDEELEARELAQANQEQVLDDFIDPTGTGAVSTTDLGSMADASGSFKDNFNTGQSASGIWNVFDRDYDWFSQTTANNLQPSLTRSAEEYSTPYLDEYYEELNSILEVNKRD